MDVFVTDGRLVDHSLSAKPYTDHAFDMPAQYAAPDGLDLRLYGRSADGESVVVEKNIESLSIALILDVYAHIYLARPDLLRVNAAQLLKFKQTL